MIIFRIMASEETNGESASHPAPAQSTVSAMGTDSMAEFARLLAQFASGTQEKMAGSSRSID